MNILIVDDSNDKIASIVTEIRQLSPSFEIDSSVDIGDAKRKLHDKKYDLLLIDLLLPVRVGEEPIPEGGANLVNEIARSKSFIAPSYILGITQYEEHIPYFSNIWKAIKYDPTSENWKNTLKEVLNYLLKSSNGTVPIPEVKPTIFVEGKTDEALYKEAIQLFAPEIIDKVIIKSEKSAGASWVTRQLVIWSHSLHSDTNKNYIKAIGIYDGDVAGKDAIQELNRIVKNDGAEAKTYKTLSLTATYAQQLIPLFQKGVIIPVTLEELFNPDLWKFALEKGWVEARNNPEEILKDPKSWDKFNQSFKDFIKSLSLSEQEAIYLNKFKKEHKADFSKHLTALDADKKKVAFANFEALVKDLPKLLCIN